MCELQNCQIESGARCIALIADKTTRWEVILGSILSERRAPPYLSFFRSLTNCG